MLYTVRDLVSGEAHAGTVHRDAFEVGNAGTV